MFRAILWHVLMLIWLGGLISGVWWIWPNFSKPAVSTDLIAGVLWLAIGAVAWVIAFNYGRQRYWRQR